MTKEELNIIYNFEDVFYKLGITSEMFIDLPVDKLIRILSDMRSKERCDT